MADREQIARDDERRREIIGQLVGVRTVAFARLTIEVHDLEQAERLESLPESADDSRAKGRMKALGCGNQPSRKQDFAARGKQYS